MVKSKQLGQELLWALLCVISAYLLISVKSSFRPGDLFVMCHGSTVTFYNYVVVIQLALLIYSTRQLYKFIMNITNERWRLGLLPVVLFAFPVCIVILWIQWVGC